MKQPDLFIRHIIDAATKIEAYTRNISFDEFSTDDMRYYATIHLIEIIGEASSKLEADFKDSHPQIPWVQIKAMRNFLAHAYWETDLKQVWKTAKEDIPRLKDQLKKSLQLEK